ncbi:MAG TPA: anti-sigma regulatory factor [Bacillota bacterium]|nr:anti-sigma regulatory factor [Bacillota bacterium]
MKRETVELTEFTVRSPRAAGATLNSEFQGELRITSEGDIVAARKAIRNAATGLGFGLIEVTRIVTAASELTRNIYQYAGSGSVRWRSLTKAGAVGLELAFEDQGPGITDISQAMEAGFSTGRGMGLGLPGAKRLMDEMRIQTAVGQGTLVEVRKWLK